MRPDLQAGDADLAGVDVEVDVVQQIVRRAAQLRRTGRGAGSARGGKYWSSSRPTISRTSCGEVTSLLATVFTSLPSLSTVIRSAISKTSFRRCEM